MIDTHGRCDPVRRRIVILLIVALCGVSSVQPAQSQDSVPSSVMPDAATEAIDRLWSPYCPGLMLEVCSSAGGAAMRDSIQDQARAGLTPDSIVEFWVARYGEEYRALPTFDGAGRIAWVTPFLALLAGFAVAWTVVARRSRDRIGPEPVEVSAEEETRLAEALAELDRAEAPEF